jgi:ABC-2 type transport system permease protein
MQVIAHASPATYALEAMRAAMLRDAGWAELLPYLALLMAMGLVTIPLGVWTFARAEHYAKRTGRLKRTG